MVPIALAHWRSEEDDEQSDALSHGFEVATGEIFGWLNLNDMLLPGCLFAGGASLPTIPTSIVLSEGRFSSPSPAASLAI